MKSCFQAIVCLLAAMAGMAAPATAAELPGPPAATETNRMPASIGAQYAMLREMARTEALPRLIESLTHDAASPEAQAFGRSLERKAAGMDIDADALTDGNPAYWRVVVAGGASATAARASKVCLLLAAGLFDRSTTHANLFRRQDPAFADAPELTGILPQVAEFNAAVKARIQEGIVLHDAGEFDKAKALYEEILAQYPHSAWALYERFQSARLAPNFRDESMTAALRAEWLVTREKIWLADPLYPHVAMATEPREFFDLSRRVNLQVLEENPKLSPDPLLEYAEIALDLNAPGMAAELFWAASRQRAEDTGKSADALAGFVICLESLGISDCRTWFDMEGLDARIAAQKKAQQERAKEWANAEE